LRRGLIAEVIARKRVDQRRHRLEDGVDGVSPTASKKEMRSPCLRISIERLLLILVRSVDTALHVVSSHATITSWAQN
jgi:hypothetical protein